MSTVYYSPEDFGLTMVGDVEAAGGYEFDMLAVWRRDEDGALFWSTDSGCSCFSPFDGMESPDEHLERIRDVAAFAQAARAWSRKSYRMHTRDQVESLIRRARRRWVA
ncbi:hypothetical protein [Streptomyces sp. CAU 1734]|uniref:DUF7574 domain-containing protein n=1 Tax=Streptomyces sp. CAU 1734 TaxID=3140360 RepID=UPI003260D8C4